MTETTQEQVKALIKTVLQADFIHPADKVTIIKSILGLDTK